MASGAAVGSAAAFPGIGTLVAMSAIAGETVVFLEATAVFVLAVAEVYGIPADHRERRRALVLAVLVGEDSKHAVADLIGPGRTSGAWMSDGAASLPLPAVSQLNSRLLKFFVKRLRAEARGHRVRQDAARRHRCGRRWRRQQGDGQARSSGTPGRRSATRRRAGRRRCTCCPRPKHRRAVRPVDANTMTRSPLPWSARVARDSLYSAQGRVTAKKSRRANTTLAGVEGIEARSCREQFTFTIRTERMAGRGDVPQVPRGSFVGRSQLARIPRRLFPRTDNGHNSFGGLQQQRTAGRAAVTSRRRDGARPDAYAARRPSRRPNPQSPRQPTDPRLAPTTRPRCCAARPPRSSRT